MIQMHCDRCMTGEKVRWSEGRERGAPMLPDNWGEIEVPLTTAARGDHEKYVLCEDCITELHFWVANGKNDVDEQLQGMEGKTDLSLTARDG